MTERQLFLSVVVLTGLVMSLVICATIVPSPCLHKCHQTYGIRQCATVVIPANDTHGPGSLGICYCGPLLMRGHCERRIVFTHEQILIPQCYITVGGKPAVYRYQWVTGARFDCDGDGRVDTECLGKHSTPKPQPEEENVPPDNRVILKH